MNTVKEIACAKVNLFLDVSARREDGFHDIKTLMMPVTLCDELTVCIRPSSKKEVRIFAKGDVRIPTDGRNLAFRAAELYMNYLGVSASVEIRLEKRIPVAAGLAGGSADAAATLRAMNRLYQKPLTQKALLKLSSVLGSDVPFCLMGQSALCEGRGEIMTPVRVARPLSLVIAVADEYVSTPMAYARLDELYGDFDRTDREGKDRLLADLMEYLASRSGEAVPLYNIFESAVLPMCKGAKSIKERMQALGARATLMSGSGPSVFGIYEDQAAARHARDALIREGYRAFYATPLL